MERRLTKSEVIEKFQDDPETLEALANWAIQVLDKSYLSTITPIDQAMVDRMKYLLQFTDTTTVQVEDEGLDGEKSA